MKIYDVEKTRAKLYYCGSPPLKDFIESNGIVHVDSYINKRTGKRIWIFIMTDKLSEFLKIWSANRDKKGVSQWRMKD